MTVVDTKSYPTTVSSDGKYYTSTFDSGIVIDKGNNIELSIKGDITGGSARTIDFDVYKRTDLYAVGETFNYGILPANGSTASAAANYDTGIFTTSQPWYDAYQATVSAGTLNVSKATSVAAQNIAINLADQVLGGFEVEAKGEPVSVSQITFNIGITNAGTGSLVAASTDIDNVSLYNASGNIVAGPKDASSNTVIFSDTVTFPVGKGVYTLKGKLATNFENNDTIAASTTPSSQFAGTVVGVNTGVTITPSPTSAVTANTMTVKAGALEISVSPIPLAQTIIAGTNQFLFANYLLDAGASGEDVSLNSFQVEYNAPFNPTNLTHCTLYDGSLTLNTGSSILNPTTNASATSITFDAPLIIPKGTSKTIGLKCDIAGNATANNYYAFGYDATAADLTPTGKTSGQTIAETENDSNGQIMTIAAAGTYTVVDDSTAGYTIVSSGTTGVTLLKLKFAATTENVEIQKVALELSSTASNTPNDLVGRTVKLYDAASPTVAIGEAIFSTGDYATSTLLTNFVIPAGGSKSMLVKGDIAAISGTVGPLTASGDLLIMNYDGNANGISNGNYGRGVSSGQNITPSSSDVTPAGVRIMKAYPTFAKLDLSTSQLILQTKSGATLYKFKVTANAGDVYAYKWTFYIGSSSVMATTSAYGVYAFTDSGFSVADTAYSTDGLVNYGNAISASTTDITQTINCWGKGCRPLYVEVYPYKSTGFTTYKIPSGETRWFELRANVSNVESTASFTEYITVQLEGDVAYPTVLPGGGVTGILTGTAGQVDTDTNNDFIWSPNSTTTSCTRFDIDFTNGYSIVGLPTTNMLSETLTSAN